MNNSHFVEHNVTSELQPSSMGEVRLADDLITSNGSSNVMCYGSCDPGGPRYDRDVNHEDQDQKDFGDAAKEKLNNDGQAIKRTAEKIGDKAGELKDKTKEKIQEGVDAIKGN